MVYSISSLVISASEICFMCFFRWGKKGKSAIHFSVCVCPTVLPKLLIRTVYLCEAQRLAHAKKTRQPANAVLVQHRCQLVSYRLSYRFRQQTLLISFSSLFSGCIPARVMQIRTVGLRTCVTEAQKLSLQ